MAAGDLTDVERRVLAAVDDEDTLTVLDALISVPSEGGSQAEVDIQHRSADRLADLGLEVDLWPLNLDELRAVEDYPGEEVARNQAWGLVGTSTGDGLPALILQGHLDVVPPGDRTAWSGDPYEPRVVNGSVVGRGACDMKGGVAALLGAVSAVVRSGVPLVRPYAVHLVIGEEDGGIGAFGTIRRGHRGEACVIPEPTNLELITATAGALSFRIEVPGRATHGSTRYVGSSALDSYLAIHAALQDLEARRNADPEPLLRHLPVPYPLSVGRVRTGDWASTVPDLLVAEGRYGIRVTEQPSDARRELETAVAAAAAGDLYLRDHPPRVTWFGGQFHGGQLLAGHRLRHLVGQAHADVTGGPPPEEHGAPYGSDLRHYAAAGIPTLHYGPGDVRLAHSPDESIPLDQHASATRVLALVLVRSCANP